MTRVLNLLVMVDVTGRQMTNGRGARRGTLDVLLVARDSGMRRVVFASLAGVSWFALGLVASGGSCAHL